MNARPVPDTPQKALQVTRERFAAVIRRVEIALRRRDAEEIDRLRFIAELLWDDMAALEQYLARREPGGGPCSLDEGT